MPQGEDVENEMPLVEGGDKGISSKLIWRQFFFLFFLFFFYLGKKILICQLKH